MQIDEHITYRSLILLLVVSLAALTFGFLSKKAADEMKSGSQTIEAKITESQITEKKGKKKFAVKYAFKPTPESAEVSQGDFLGRKNLWATLPEAEYKQAIASKTIQVRYATTNPYNNRPASDDSGDSSSTLFLALGGFFALTSIVGFVRKSRAAANAA